MNDALKKGGGVSLLVLPVGARDHAQGSCDAAVTLLEGAGGLAPPGPPLAHLIRTSRCGML